MPAVTYTGLTIPPVPPNRPDSIRHACTDITASTGDEARILPSSVIDQLFHDPRFSIVRALMPGNGLEKKFSLGEWHLDLEPLAPLWMGCRQIKTVHMTPCWTEGPTASRRSSSSTSRALSSCRGPCGVRRPRELVDLSCSGGRSRCCRHIATNVGMIFRTASSARMHESTVLMDKRTWLD